MYPLGKCQYGKEEELNVPQALVKYKKKVRCDHWTYVLG